MSAREPAFAERTSGATRGARTVLEGLQQVDITGAA